MVAVGLPYLPYSKCSLPFFVYSSMSLLLEKVKVAVWTIGVVIESAYFFLLSPAWIERVASAYDPLFFPAGR